MLFFGEWKKWWMIPPKKRNALVYFVIWENFRQPGH